MTPQRPDASRSRTFIVPLALLIVLAMLSSPAGAQALKPRPTAIKPQRTVLNDDVFSDRLTVKFKDGFHVRLRNGQLTDEVPAGAAEALASPRAQAVLQAVAGGEWSRAYPVNEQRLTHMRDVAQQTLGREIADLNLQFDLRLPGGISAADVIDMFNALESVELAQPLPRPVPLPVPPNFQSAQAYLNPAPAGVDAVNAWTADETTGAGIRIADVEYSWNFAHQDLPAVTLLGPAPVDPFNDKNHGTAVLGEVGSLKNDWGTTGIAHDSTLFVAAANTAGGYNVGGAIITAAAALSAGDVIIIEQQTNGPAGPGLYVPVEWFWPNYNAIVTAVGNGIVVVEAAGNGNQNLDGPLFSTGNGGHWPFLPENDSGAIIVGAGAAPPPFGSTVDRSRLSFSTYGSTVDLQGWGESVWTSGYGNSYSAEGVNLWYTSTFSGTSSASPIVAGACALVESRYKAQFGVPLPPLQVRDLLRDTGSPQQSGANPASQTIGSRPNVTAAIASFVPQPPANNSCTNAALLEAGSHPYTTVLASTDGPDESGCGVGQLNNDIWFLYGVACAPATVTVSTCGSTFDTRLAAYMGICPGGPGSTIACNDNFCGDDAEISFHVNDPVLLVLRLGGATTATGTGNLVITCTPDGPGCTGDTDNSGAVNIDDLLFIINNWGTTNPTADIDDDGDVDIDDLLGVINNWGSC